MEATGLALGIAGLLAGFDGAIKGYLLIASFFESDNGSEFLALRYHIEKHKLSMWGDFFKVADPPNCLLKDQPQTVKELILRILGEIEKTHQQASKYVKKYTTDLGKLPVGDSDKNLQPDSPLVKALAKLSLAKKPKHWTRVMWCIEDRNRFTELLARLTELNRDLYGVLKPSDRDLLSKTLSSYVLASIDDKQTLRGLQSAQSGSSTLIALSARLKELQNSSATASKEATRIVKGHLVGLSSSQNGWTTGLLQLPQSLDQSVWIEWCQLEASLSPEDRTKMIERINALSTMLEAVSVSALRIPPCLGVFDDADFGVSSQGAKRLGFVFTAPFGDYEDNFKRFKPISLQEHIEATRSTPPLLGDRFKLAYTLASSFSLFHASRWLHKAFRTDNILFFQHRNSSSSCVSILEPYITGFQYSRPEQTESITYRSGGDPETDYYYHLEVANGFTKSLDLYSLGVVLFEIGRWELLKQALPDNKKAKITQTAWTEKFLINYGVEDLGWRMGAIYSDVVRTLLECNLPQDDDELFAHEFFSKIIRQLDLCCA